jgi:TrmH family RNA methyltransferase
MSRKILTCYLRLTHVTQALPRLPSRQHPVVRAFRDAAATSAPHVLLDGAHLVREALAAGLPLAHLLVTAHFRETAAPFDAELIAAAMASGVTVHEAAPAVVSAASPVRTSSGIVALARWQPVPLAAAFASAPALVIALVDVQDPGNVGAVIRSADALGATAVLALDRTAHPGGWKALRGAMGSTFRLPVARASWTDALSAARAAGVRIVATGIGGGTRLDACDLTQPTVVLVGNEGAGLSPEAAAQADERATITMRAGVNSLNVAVTAAIVLYEARAQRRSA